MDPQRRRTLVAAVIVGVVFAGASYAIGQQIKQSTEETASGAPPAATITSEAVLVPARGPSLPGLPRPPKDESTTTAGTTGPTATTGTTTTPSTDIPSTDQPSTDIPSTDQPSTDQPSTDQPSTDQPSTDRPTTDVTDFPTDFSGDTTTTG